MGIKHAFRPFRYGAMVKEEPSLFEAQRTRWARRDFQLARFNLKRAVDDSLADVINEQHGKTCTLCRRGDLGIMCETGKKLYREWEVLKMLASVENPDSDPEKFLHIAPPSPFLDRVQDIYDGWTRDALVTGEA